MTSENNMDLNKEKYTTLLEEYKLLKQDAFIHINFYNQQYNFMHLFTLGIFGVLSFFATNLIKDGSGSNQTITMNLFNEATIQSNSIFFIFFVLLASIFLLYYISLIMSSAMKFRFIRDRLGEIEKEINSILGSDILKYELHQAPAIYERLMFKKLLFTPSAFSLFSRLGLIVIFASILWFVSYQIGGGFYYIYIVVSIAIFFFLIKSVYGILVSKDYKELLKKENE